MQCKSKHRPFISQNGVLMGSNQNAVWSQHHPWSKVPAGGQGAHMDLQHMWWQWKGGNCFAWHKLNAIKQWKPTEPQCAVHWSEPRSQEQYISNWWTYLSTPWTTVQLKQLFLQQEPLPLGISLLINYKVNYFQVLNYFDASEVNMLHYLFAFSHVHLIFPDSKDISRWLTKMQKCNIKSKWKSILLLIALKTWGPPPPPKIGTTDLRQGSF